MTVPSRLLVIDAMDGRLASQLEQRGRNALSVDRLGLAGANDPSLLRWLAKHHPDCVLVTGDDDMPGEHGPLITRLRLAIATIDGRVDVGWGPAEWKREIVHRWAHAMETQKRGTTRRYGPASHVPWTRRTGRTRT